MRRIKNKIPDFLLEFLSNPYKLKEKEIGKIIEAPFTIEQLKQIALLVKELLKDVPNLIDLRGNEAFKDVLIVGDTHGFLNSTLRITKPFLDGKVDSILFLGDYVDRGPHSLLNLVFIIGIMLAWPDRVVVLRGNHEDLRSNSLYGFKKELFSYYPFYIDFKKIELIINHIYEYLSIAAITPQGSIVFHGGIPNVLNKIQELNIIPKPHSSMINLPKKSLRMKAYKIWEQIRWNDPKENQKRRFKKSNRGPYIRFFNDQVLNAFLLINTAKRVIRAHEATKEGFKTFFDGKLLNIFSTEPYFGEVKKGYILHETRENKIFLRDLDFNYVKKIK
ncbi:MAG: metallophosphoesterase [Promethearchaeota archaeon]